MAAVCEPSAIGQDVLVSPRLQSLLQPPVAFGSRGAMADAPENTLQSFRLALDMGATGVQSDVWITADRVPVLDRDGRIGSFLRRSNIAETKRSALPEHVPTVQDLFELVGTDLPISLDVRDPSGVTEVIAIARQVGGDAERNLWLSHPDLLMLTQWRVGTEARLINSVRLRSLPGGLERRMAELQQRDLDGLSMPHGDWNGGRIALAHRFDRLAVGLGANYERELATVIDAGIDAVSSEHVDRMMAVMAEFYPPSQP